MNLHDLSFSFFDLVVIGVVAAGVASGRRHGMSIEALQLAKWVAILLGCAATYAFLGEEFEHRTLLLGPLSSYILAYVCVGLTIALVFSLVKRSLGGKILDSDAFGQGEYYLGMASGALRYLCVLLTGLAILNARAFSDSEARAMVNFQKDELGSEFFPTLLTAQNMVFDQSLSGSWIHRHLDFLLIKRTEPDHRSLTQAVQASKLFPARREAPTGF